MHTANWKYTKNSVKSKVILILGIKILVTIKFIGTRETQQLLQTEICQQITVLQSKRVDIYYRVHVAVYLQQRCMLIHVIIYTVMLVHWVFKS